MRSQEQTSMLRSRPVRVNWAGFQTDTFTLQQQGWSLSADQDVCRMQMRLAMRNERLGMVGITEPVEWDFFHYARDPVSQLPTLRMQIMSRQVNVIHEWEGALSNFRPIDAMPQMIERKVTALEDLVHFNPSLARTQQMIVPEESVDDLMARILEMQQGTRIERIRNEIAEGAEVSFVPQQKFHAQIISLAA